MAIIKRATTANEYFKYCEEVGCDVWGILESIPNALYEPVGFWLPKHLVPSKTSTDVQGIEVPMDDDATIPEGFEHIVLEPCQVMIFQGNPYDDAFFALNINAIRKAIDQYNPEI
jgi:AraC family transcriptional regulator